jgi:hypothetical protein
MKQRQVVLAATCFWFIVAMFLVCTPPSRTASRPVLVIERFERIPDCFFPDRRRGILSYRVTGDVTRVNISALHRGGRVRLFHTQPSPVPVSSLAATDVVDPGATADVERYRLLAIDGRGREVSRELSFRYRVADFALLSPLRHTRVTAGGSHLTIYNADVRAVRVDSLTCSFRFDAPIGGESGRAGRASVDPRPLLAPERPIVICEIEWRDVRKARAGGTVEWVARVTDPCTQGRIMRSARVNAIP